MWGRMSLCGRLGLGAVKQGLCGGGRCSKGSGVYKRAYGVYVAGLRYTEFSNELKITKEHAAIPIFRVLDPSGRLLGDWAPPWTDVDVLDLYKKMVTFNFWDDQFFRMQRQGRTSFYIQNAGEEGIQFGVGKAMDESDHIFGQYRETGILWLKGYTLDDMLNQLFSNDGDEGKGRQMPISYGCRAKNIHTICTPLTTQLPHAAGAGYALRLDHTPAAAFTFFGEGAASEGDFHAAMNFAAVLKAQTIFCCRNNGYAISTPALDQYAGDGIAIRGLAYGMETIRVDGNDLFASYYATQKAREICVTNKEPVCMEFMTYRQGHHSTSDDSSQYRPHGEMDQWQGDGIDPIARIANYLKTKNIWSETLYKDVIKDAKKSLKEALARCEPRLRCPIVSGMFDDVYDIRPPHIQQQAESLSRHLKEYGTKYDLTRYRPAE